MCVCDGVCVCGGVFVCVEWDVCVCVMGCVCVCGGGVCVRCVCVVGCVVYVCVVRCVCGCGMCGRVCVCVWWCVSSSMDIPDQHPEDGRQLHPQRAGPCSSGSVSIILLEMKQKTELSLSAHCLALLWLSQAPLLLSHSSPERVNRA